MKKKRFTVEQIERILNKHGSGRPAKELCREYSISSEHLLHWKKKYGGMDAIQLKQLKELEEENNKLKQMFADASLDI